MWYVSIHCEQYNPDPRPPTHTSGTSCSFAPSPLWRKYAPKFARGYVFFSRAARQRYYSNLMYSTCSVQCTTCAAREGRIGIFKFFCCLQLGRGLSYQGTAFYLQAHKKTPMNIYMPKVVPPMNPRVLLLFARTSYVIRVVLGLVYGFHLERPQQPQRHPNL